MNITLSELPGLAAALVAAHSGGLVAALVEQPGSAEELARRESNDALVPIDRDPVPPQFSELVRRYYEQLGKSE